MLLKKGESAGLNLFQIANMICRENLNRPSILEGLCSQAERKLQGSEDSKKFLEYLEYLFENEIQRLKYLSSFDS